MFEITEGVEVDAAEDAIISDRFIDHLHLLYFRLSGSGSDIAFFLFQHHIPCKIIEKNP